MNEPKRLYRAMHSALFMGVCAGVAEYFNLDANIVRLAFIILAFFGGMGVWVYLAGALLLPKEPLI